MGAWYNTSNQLDKAARSHTDIFDAFKAKMSFKTSLTDFLMYQYYQCGDRIFWPNDIWPNKSSGWMTFARTPNNRNAILPEAMEKWTRIIWKNCTNMPFVLIPFDRVLIVRICHLTECRSPFGQNRFGRNRNGRITIGRGPFGWKPFGRSPLGRMLKEQKPIVGSQNMLGRRTFSYWCLT